MFSSTLIADLLLFRIGKVLHFDDASKKPGVKKYYRLLYGLRSRVR